MTVSVKEIYVYINKNSDDSRHIVEPEVDLQNQIQQDLFEQQTMLESRIDALAAETNSSLQAAISIVSGNN